MSSAGQKVRGYILASTIWVLAFLSIAAASIGEWYMRSLSVAGDRADGSRALEAEFSTRAALFYKIATADLGTSGIFMTDWVPDDESGRGSWIRPGRPDVVFDGAVYQGYGDVRFAIQDESGLMGLLPQTTTRTRDLLITQGVDYELADVLAARLADYADRDELVRINGAEATDYRFAGLEPPTNRRLESVYELKRVMGWSELDFLWQDNELPSLLTLAWAGSPNPATAPRAVLLRMPGATQDLVDELIASRRGDGGEEGSGDTEAAAWIDQLQRRSVVAAIPTPSRSLRLRFWRDGEGHLREYSVRFTPGEQGLMPWVIEKIHANRCQETNLVKHHDLRNYLVSSCRYLQAEAGVDVPPTSALWVEWVVCRSLCVFRSLDVSSIAAPDLEAVLQLRVREWAPFADPEHCYRVFGNRALVWAWDGELRREHCRQCGVKPDVVLAESLVVASAPADGEPLVLVECQEGCEARYYQGEKLVQSRWWPQVPDKRSWNQFRMLFDLAPADEVPAPVPGEMPEGRSVPLASLLQPFLRAESTLFAFSVGVFAIFAAYYLAGILFANLAVQRTEARIAELNTAVTPVLEARDAALASLDAIDKLAGLHSGPLQIQYLSDLMARLAEARDAGKDVELMAWDYSPSGLAISVAAETLSAAELLNVFEVIPWLASPRVGDDPVRGRMRITGELVEDWRFDPGLEAGNGAGSGADISGVDTSGVDTSGVETSGVIVVDAT